MKIKNRKLKKSKNSLIFIILLLFISIGFAAFSRNLNIFGSSILKGQKFDVHFENVQVSSDGLQIDTPAITDKTTVEYGVTLEKIGDFLEFTVDAKNDGTVDAMISSLDQIKICDEVTEEEIAGISEFLDYSITYLDYEDVPIVENHLLKAGKKVTYKVRIEYKEYLEEETRLKAIFKVEYTQANDNSIKVKHPSTESTLSIAELQNFGANKHPKEVIFVDTGVSDFEDEKYVDVSKEQDWSILAWMDGETMYVSAKEAGLYVKAPNDSTKFLGDGYVSNDWIEKIEKIDVLKLDTSDVTKMNQMFSESGSRANDFKIVGLKNWDTSNVTSMTNLFTGSGSFAETWIIDDLSDWDTSKVTKMTAMFNGAGFSAVTYEIKGLDKWNTSNVIDMSNMFYQAGRDSQTFNIGDISGWDTSSVTDMSNMFRESGYNATAWSIGDISKWDTSNVKNMNYMFSQAGKKANYYLNLSNWNVDKTIDHSKFNDGVTSKITPPNWVR